MLRAHAGALQAAELTIVHDAKPRVVGHVMEWILAIIRHQIHLLASVNAETLSATPDRKPLIEKRAHVAGRGALLQHDRRSPRTARRARHRLVRARFHR